MFNSDSAELLFLSERFAHIEDGELRTENIKRRIKLMWKFVKPTPAPARVVNKPPEEPKFPMIDGHGDVHDKPFSFYKRADAGSDLIEQLKQRENDRAELAATVSKTMAKYK